MSYAYYSAELYLVELKWKNSAQRKAVNGEKYALE